MDFLCLLGNNCDAYGWPIPFASGQGSGGAIARAGVIAGDMIEIEDAVFGYQGRAVAGPLSLRVPPREVLAVVGASGCGKTTMLKSVAGVLPLLGGGIRLEGRKRDREWLRANLARTLQNFPLLHWLTVEGNLRVACRLRGLSSADAAQVLAEFSAEHLMHKYPRTLSGGERCRASLAQAAITRPKILLLDEPLNGLDFHVKEGVAESLFSFCTSHNASIVFVTHDLHDACTYSNRVAILGGGPPATIAAIVNVDGASTVPLVRAHLLKAGQYSAAPQI